MSPVRRIAAGLVLATVAALAITTPAWAHDQLVSSTPSADERLTVPPENVTMTFSGEPLVLDDSVSGAVVLVVDAAGNDWVVGDVTVDGRNVTAPLDPGMPTAGYQVRWQVVSEDGHPIAGVIPFTVGDAEPLSMGPVEETTGEASDDAAATLTADSPSAEQSDQNAESHRTFRLLSISTGGAALAVLVFVLVQFRRPRTAAAPQKHGDSAAHDL